MCIRDSIKALFEKVVNPHIDKIKNKRILPFTVDISGADPDDCVYPQGFQSNPDGTMWSHVQHHGNLGPFYELLIDDSETATTAIYRKPAFMALSTTSTGMVPIFAKAGAPKIYKIAPELITHVSAARSEHDVSNWFFVRAPRGDFLSTIDQKLQSNSTNGSQLSLKNYGNCKEDLYGFRSMEVDTFHGNLKGQPINGENMSTHAPVRPRWRNRAWRGQIDQESQPPNGTA